MSTLYIHNIRLKICLGHHRQNSFLVQQIERITRILYVIFCLVDSNYFLVLFYHPDTSVLKQKLK